MRHDRSAEFDSALAAATTAPSTNPRRWHEVADDPNDPRALVQRAQVLRDAWRPPVADRIAFFEERCAGKHVLDIGCVAHDVARMASPSWLHARIAAVADRCVGVDILESGVEAMREAGFDAICHDLADGLGPLAGRAPFDVIVAGELFEHVADLDMLFRVADEALAPGGELIVTTPNPYAPDRVRAGQRGIVVENVDHVVYAFPSGIAELCERHGLRLSEAMTSTTRRRRVRGVAKSMVRTVRGAQWATAGFTTRGELAQAQVRGGALTALHTMLGRRRRQFVGETFYYVVCR